MDISFLKLLLTYGQFRSNPRVDNFVAVAALAADSWITSSLADVELCRADSWSTARTYKQAMQLATCLTLSVLSETVHEKSLSHVQR